MSESNLWRGLHRPDIPPPEADFIMQGIAFDGGCSQRKGAAQAPDYIRKRSERNPPVTDRGEVLNIDIHDRGNLKPKSGESQEDFFARAAQEAAKIFSWSEERGWPLPIFLGGDHSVTIPILRGLQLSCGETLDDVAIIHIDSHLDVCDELEGNRLSHGSPHRRGWELEMFSPQETYFIGIRSMEEQEVNFLRDKPHNIYRAEEVSSRGVEAVAAEITAGMEAENVYLTLDIDALDPAFAPGTGTPVAGGLSTEQVYRLLKQLSSLSFLGMDLVEVSPPWDNSEITSYAAQRLLFAFIGFMTPAEKKSRPLQN